MEIRLGCLLAQTLQEYQKHKTYIPRFSPSVDKAGRERRGTVIRGGVIGLSAHLLLPHWLAAGGVYHLSELCK